MRVYVGVTEKGHAVGEHHHRATITDETVDKIREMHEDRGRSYAVIARVLKLSVRTVAMICQYKRRCTTPDRWVMKEINLTNK